MHSLVAIIAASEEKSEAPYFVIGGLFAAWAVIVSIIGLRTPSFPKTKAQGRLALLVSVVLAAGTFAALVAVTV